VRIEKNRDLCTVIVTVDAPPDVMPRLEAHARAGIHGFAECPGYLGGAMHVSEDGTRLVQYLQWTSEAHYRKCVEDPRWDELSTTAEFMDAIREGRARVDARTFYVAESHS
jgi:hypothetical protein